MGRKGKVHKKTKEDKSRLLRRLPKLSNALQEAISTDDTLKSVVFQSYGYPFSNVEIDSLQRENQRLKRKVDELTQAKITLAIRTNEAIDKFRQLFLPAPAQ